MGEGSASRPGRSLPPRKTRYPLYRKLDGPQGRSGQVRKISPPTGIRSPDLPDRSQSLYRLSYPAHMCARIRLIGLSGSHMRSNVYNTTVHATSTYTRFALMYGFRSEVLSALRETPNLQYDCENYLTELRGRLQSAHDDCQANTDIK